MNANNKLKVNDVVRITKGIFRNQLAIIIDDLSNILSYRVKIILNGVEVVYRTNTLLFCYNNDEESIKLWHNIIKYNQDKMVKCYSDIKYIKDNFDKDIFIANNITFDTILNIIKNNEVIDMFDWFYDNKTALSIIFYYDRPSFVLEYCRLIDKTISKEEILRLHKAAWS